jgi:transmembrane sensor
MEKQEQIESVIYKFLARSASEEENEKLTEWLTESNENRLYYFTIKRIWLEGKEIPDKIKMTDASWDRLKLRTFIQSSRKIRDNYKPHINIRKLSVAATILILIGISSFFGIKLKSLSEYQKTTHEITVPLGSRTNITLPDGTNVWLNADSKLTYTSDFGLRNRDVSLSGEAYFDVRHQGNSFFSVNTRDVNIKVLGTQFNVKSYPDEEVTETTIVSGKVEVNVTEAGITARPVLLTQNQRITYSRTEGRLVTRPVETFDHEIVVVDTLEVAVKELVQKPSLQISQISSPEEYTSWKDGKLVFRAETLKSLAPKLERFYNVNISFENDSVKDLSYTGTLDEVTIEEVLRAIAAASKINYDIDKNNVIFSIR